MTAKLLPQAKQQYFDAAGNLLSGGKVYTYLAGTTTNKTTWSDAAQTSANTNPVILDSRGEADIFWNGNYKIAVTTAADAPVWTRDNINSTDLETLATLAASGGSALVGFIQAGTGAVARTAQAKMREPISAGDFGATGNGTTDDRAAIVLADAAGPFMFTAGSYKIASNLTITNDITIASGAKFVIPAGITLTINGAIAARATQIFDATAGGTVVINGQRTPTGWAEWWGLTESSPGSAAANTTAINAATVALRETRLLARTYYTSGQITVSTSNRVIAGSGAQYDGVNEGQITRILCTSATAHIVYAGATSFTTIAALPRGIVVRDVYVARSVAPDITSGCTGIYAKWAQFSRLENCKSNNSQHGFQFSGTVQQKVIDCHALRDTAGTGGADAFNGFYVEGATSIGLNGSNASLRLVRPVTEMGIVIAGSRGIYADHKMTDLFIEQPEATACAISIEIFGDSANTTLNQDNTDVMITGHVLDQFTFAGIYIHGLNKYGSVEIKGGYYGAASGATAALYVLNNLATVRAEGGQFLMAVGTTTYGVRVATSSNVEIAGAAINECTAAAVVLDTVTNCKIAPFVKNNSNVCAVAVQTFNANTGCVIEPMVSGGASKVSLGIQVNGTTDARNEYRLSGIDSACITTSSANKLTRNGVQIVATGLSGTNLVSGVTT